MNADALAAKLTTVAVAEFENPRIRVYARAGVLWIATTRLDGGEYTFDSVGVPRQGIRRLAAEVKRIAEGKR